MTDRDGEPGLISESLQLEFPQRQPMTVAASGVGGDEDARRPHIDAAAFGSPPPADGSGGEVPGNVIGADIPE